MYKTVAVPLAMLLVSLARAAPEDTRDAPVVPVIEQIPGVRMTPLPRQGFRRARPQTLEDAEALAAALGEAAAKRILAQVDLQQRVLILFRWSGSGGDRLSYRVEQTKEGPKVVFRYRPGRTKDLRPHAHLFAIRRGVAWEVGPKDSPPRLPRRKPAP